ncbi:MAG: hypothetical protein AB7U20_06005 [Planctomycetaceae bacterium]
MTNGRGELVNGESQLQESQRRRGSEPDVSPTICRNRLQILDAEQWQLFLAGAVEDFAVRAFVRRQIDQEVGPVGAFTRAGRTRRGQVGREGMS